MKGNNNIRSGSMQSDREKQVISEELKAA